MKFIIIGRNIDITEGLKSAVQEKLGKLERYFTPETEIHVTLSVEKDSYYSGKRKHHSFRTGEQRYVCIH